MEIAQEIPSTLHVFCLTWVDPSNILKTHAGPSQVHRTLVIDGVVEGCTMKFFTKICNGCPPCNNTTHIPISDASHSSLKVFEKFGKARMGALSFKPLKGLLMLLHPTK